MAHMIIALKILKDQRQDLEVVIKVDGCGICAGDCKANDGAQMFGEMTHGSNPSSWP